MVFLEARNEAVAVDGDAEATDGIIYPLLLMPRVKGQTKVSAKHQVTIPVSALRDAGVRTGDVLKVEADGAGRLILTRVDELLARYSGRLSTGGTLGKAVEGLREEWR
ncbi:MAG TPA: AbrB/MazE/SpoVT family DNA-binding domain-containing protein [Solirubrobacterales bacterium]|jgi:bifunctional DNA-binding transcriptional regulator/antitoxin component of YhaV-PrlF toxin-antitoxin module|nr:AbrB/MazE/SpoVT family DNA-binding domain-containing protein [Solirubrobacterales bacterium]